MTMPIPEGMTVKTVIDNYIKAIGGKDKVDAVKSVMITADATIQGTPVVMTTKNAAPNKSSLVVSVMGNVMQKVVFDGTTGYIEARGQKMPMPEAQINEAKNAAAPFSDMNYISGTLDRIEPIEGSNYYVIKMDKTEVFYDVKTGLKYQEVKTAKGPQGEVKVPTIFSDYKKVNGVLFPYTIGQKMGPMDMKFVVKEIKVNEGVSDEDFK